MKSLWFSMIVTFSSGTLPKTNATPSNWSPQRKVVFQLSISGARLVSGRVWYCPNLIWFHLRTKNFFDCRKHGPSLFLQSGHWWKALSNVLNKKIWWHDVLRWRNYVNANLIYIFKQSQRQITTPLPLPARCLVKLRQHHCRTAAGGGVGGGGAQ